MILQIENPKDYQTTIRTNELSKIAEYKIDIQKSVTFLYTNEELTEREIKKTIP